MYEQPYNPYAPNQAIVKDYFKSPKVLARGIMQILMLLMMIGTVIFSAVSMNQAFSMITSELDDIGYYGSGLGDYAGSMATSATIIPMVIAAIPVIVLAVGYILTYTGSRKETGKPNVGIMILFVMAIISLVEIGLAGVMMLFVVLMGFNAASMFSSIMGSSAYSYGYDSGAFTTILIIYLVIIALVLTYSILYSVHRMRFFNSVRKSLNSVELRHNGATGFGVMSIISAVFTGLTIPLLVLYLIALLNMPSYIRGINGGLGFWVVFIVLAAYILIGLIAAILDASIALGYKKYIENYTSGYNTPYGAAPGNGYAAPNPAPYTPYQQPYQQNYQQPAQPDYRQPVQQPYPQPAQPSYQPEPVDMQQNPYGDGFGPTEIPAPVSPFAPTDSFEDLTTPEPLPESEPLPEPEPITEPEPLPESEPIAEPEPAPQEAPAQSAFCTNCGSRVEPGSFFCSNCGNKLR